ncbi:MAG: hypothetical protein AAFO87_08105 [Cyanobacteria bacterium J06607_6]
MNEPVQRLGDCPIRPSSGWMTQLDRARVPVSQHPETFICLNYFPRDITAFKAKSAPMLQID